ncbi:uncharacterized protein E0L32_006596 [Thyridium curvatum]|uniref:SET domain-containing protein n=1 Tax=Thyridium curvatum TaxID=1093900 RepID=A0A507B7A9_9PEZI|nr:uncharacterized protein E0L32_006596 [Thyridium curvatum]TPX12951.1 hypothetical protein E0L32_006596 [Thyridium curvatum]
MKPAEAERFQRLFVWATDNGSTLHPQAEVYSDDLTKFSLRVKPDAGGSLPAGDVVVSCALPTTLSYLNALVGGPLGQAQQPAGRDAAFPQRFLDETPPHVVGRFFLVQQYLAGPSSFWHPYIATLPPPEHMAGWVLPAFWPEDDADLLEGTNAAVAAEEIRGHVAREFKAARRLLKELAFDRYRDYSRLLYNWAFCIFTSRSFRPSLVVSDRARRQLEEEASILPVGCAWDDFSLLQPLFDIANHSPLVGIDWDCAETGGSSSGDAVHDHRCQFRSRQAWPPGQQIFNNYGQKTNSELLLAYGFVLPEARDFHNDYVHLRKRQGRRPSVPCGADAAADAEGIPRAAGANNNKPRDFLISLRPMNDPSSRAGRARQTVLSDPGLALLPQFSRLEDSLLWDMLQDFATGGSGGAEHLSALAGLIRQDSAAEGVVARDHSDGEAPPVLTHHQLEANRALVLTRAFARPEAEALAPMREAIRHTLLDKLLADYEALRDGDPDDDDWRREVGEQQPRGVTANQRLALQYRGQCDRVLRAAIGALDPGVRLDVVT